MQTDEKEWADTAVQLCADATPKGVTVLLYRTEKNGESNMIITNAVSSEMARVLNFACGDSDE